MKTNQIIRSISLVFVASTLCLPGLGLAKKKQIDTGAWERPYGMGGCGLGSQVIGKGSSGQIFAVTTNQTSYNQYFGITSGTSNCVEGPKEEVANRMDQFIHGNKVALAADMARGEGETLAALSSIMGCANSDLLSVRLKENFSSIYSDEKVNTMQITDRVISVVIQDEDLQKGCGSFVG